MLEHFHPISLNDDKAGLVWHDEVVAGKYLAELQTGIIPQLVHLVIFDLENDNAAVYEAVQAYSVGESLDEANMEALLAAVDEGLAELGA